MRSVKPGLFVVVLSMACSGLIVENRSMGNSQNLTDRDTPRIDVEVVVKAGLSDVWNAWTTNKGLQAFFAKDTNVELAIGGAYEMLFTADAPKGEKGSEGCKVLSYLPMEMLSFSWNAPPKFAHARGRLTWVVMHFEELDKDRVKVRLSHLGWDKMRAAHPAHADEWVEVHHYFTRAWPFVLENLRKRFDEGSQ